jgi:hypothetical protein
MISDGEAERSVGESFQWFAVTFWTEQALSKTLARERSAQPIDDYAYRVVAEITYLTEAACIIDFGLRATSSAADSP